MDKLHDSLLLEILSRLDDSSDVARCRVASKAFDAVFPCLRSINLRYRNIKSSYFSKTFFDLLLKLETVESMSIADIPFYYFCEFRYFDEDFVKAWLPRVSGSLKSLSMSDLPKSLSMSDLHTRYGFSRRKSNVLLLIAVYLLLAAFNYDLWHFVYFDAGHNLQHLNLRFQNLSLSVHNLNPMPMLTSLTLEDIDFGYEYLHELDKCFPNLQVLNLVNVKHPSYLSLITPNLITLKIDCCKPVANIHVEAPKLTHFHLSISTLKHAKIDKIESLKSLLLDSCHIDSLLSEFPIIETVETLTLNSFSKSTLEKAFTAFPNVSSLCIDSSSLSHIEACLDPEGWEILGGMKGLKTLCAYLRVVNVSTFFNVACVLDQCVGLSEVSFLIHSDVKATKSNSFKSKCMASWPWLKWRWGVWSNKHHMCKIHHM
ncbi:F-box/LRR-repeat protein At4g29420-like [Bidens hawaiensis]|uniref:F-box/LRR-repeat protein At4g29420-like n=1 Tax=Bidens hawaiensis TaxID=980011 RepID=UPI004049257B